MIKCTELIFLVWIVLLYNAKPSSGASKDSTSLTWLEASNRCDNGGLEFRDSILKETDLQNGKLFWFGKAIYRNISTWMEILGCYNVTHATGITKLREVSSISECQIKCLSISPLYFGYKKTTFICICSEFKPAVKTTFENCEKNTLSDAYFFYREYQGHVSPGIGGNCTYLRCMGGENNLRAANCNYADRHIVGRCGKGEKAPQPQWEKTYLESLHLCMSNNLLLLAPYNYCKIDGHENQAIMSWTNVFREYKIQLTKADGGNKKPLECLAGLLVHRDGQLKLETTNKDCDQRLNEYVCLNAGTKSTKSTHTENVPDNSLLTKTITSTLYSERSSYSMHFTATSGQIYNVEQSTHRKINVKKGNNSKLVGGVIGGLLGACFIIAVSVVLIVCKLRSSGVFKGSTKHNKQETTPVQFSNTTYQDSNNTTDKRSTTPTSNETYGLAENSTPVYAVVNKIKTSENTDENYIDTGYGEYDHLHDIQNRRIGQQENLYHSHGAQRNEQDQTYDSSDFGNEKFKDGNGLYDQSFLVVEGEYSYSTNKNHDNTNNMGIYDKAS